MNTGVVSMRYAKALLAYAKKTGKEEQVYRETKKLAEIFVAVPGLRKAIDNPILDADSKLNLLCEAVGPKGLSAELKRFFSLVLKEKREKFLQFMACAYIDLYREDKNILIGKLTTAVESPQLVERMEKLASERVHGNVILETKVDPSLIGGYVFELAGVRLDASVQNQLKRVKQQFIARNRRIV